MSAKVKSSVISSDAAAIGQSTATTLATLAVPAPDSTANTYERDVIGNKEDVASETVDVASLVALLRKTLAEAHEIERHLHNYERWFGPAAVASGEDHVADPIGEVGGTPAGVITSFQFTSGANKSWGTAVQIFGATDAAVVLPSGRQAVFDLHRMRPTASQFSGRDWYLRIIAGASAAAGVTADTYSILPLFVDTTRKVQTPVDMITEREDAGTKMWVQALQTTNNSQETLDLQFAAHGYPE